MNKSNKQLTIQDSIRKAKETETRNTRATVRKKGDSTPNTPRGKDTPSEQHLTKNDDPLSSGDEEVEELVNRVLESEKGMPEHIGSASTSTRQQNPNTDNTQPQTIGHGEAAPPTCTITNEDNITSPVKSTAREPIAVNKDIMTNQNSNLELPNPRSNVGTALSEGQIPIQAENTIHQANNNTT
jgi:hypothetical protein